MSEEIKIHQALALAGWVLSVNVIDGERWLGRAKAIYRFSHAATGRVQSFDFEEKFEGEKVDSANLAMLIHLGDAEDALRKKRMEYDRCDGY